MRKISFAVCLVSLVGCAHPAKIVSPDKTITKIAWSTEDLEAGFAMQTVQIMEGSSQHVIRLVKNEDPHVHQFHDLTVFVLSGKGKVHFQKHSVDLKPGDIVTIPRGFYHWAENNDPNGTEVFAVFTPPFDGKDTVPVK